MGRSLSEVAEFYANQRAMALQTSVQQLIVVSEANFDLKFEISNLNYTGLYVQIAILVASEAMAASEVKFDLKIEVSILNQLCYHASLACKGFLEMIPTNNDKRPIAIHGPACFAAGKNAEPKYK